MEASVIRRPHGIRRVLGILVFLESSESQKI